MLPSILGSSQTGLRCSFHPLQALLPRSQYECRTDPLKPEKKSLLVVHRLFGGASTDSVCTPATVLLDICLGIMGKLSLSLADVFWQSFDV